MTLMYAIIKSLLDLDRYKLTMAQFAFFFYRSVKVKYAFTNRTKDERAQKILVSLIGHIQEEIEAVRKLRLTFFEMMHLKNQKNSMGEQLFHDDFINYLSKVELPPVNVYEKNGKLQIDFEGDWPAAMLWETIILSIVAELYSRVIASERYVQVGQIGEKGFEDLAIARMISNELPYELHLAMEYYHINAMKLLLQKIDAYKHHPSIAFFEFGTRRRFSAVLQEKIVNELNQAFHKPQFVGQSQFLGTSNEYLAMKLGIKAGGTMAHEMFMVIAGLADGATGGKKEAIVNSQYNFLREWNKFYGYDLSIALTDTFGSDHFFAHCPKDIAEMYSFREDSALDCFAYTDAVLDLYKRHKVNPWEKVCIHSNGLDKNKIIAIDSYSQGKIKKVYGQGTDLTCDVGFNFPHLSIVIKAVEVDGISLVKLSDNVAKAIGVPAQVERYKQIFDYVNEKSEIQVY